MELNQLSSQIIKAAINVHKELGPGLLESVYQSCIIIELRSMGIKVQLAKKPLGLLINFNESMLKEGITRVINSPPQAD